MESIAAASSLHWSIDAPSLHRRPSRRPRPLSATARPSRIAPAAPGAPGLFWKLLVAVCGAQRCTAILVLTALFSRRLRVAARRGSSTIGCAPRRSPPASCWPTTGRRAPTTRLQALVRRIGEQSRRAADAHRPRRPRAGRLVPAPTSPAVAAMENHRDRPEFIEAVRTGVGRGAAAPAPRWASGCATRPFASTSTGSRAGVVRASLPTRADRRRGRRARLAGWRPSACWRRWRPSRWRPGSPPKPPSRCGSSPPPPTPSSPGSTITGCRCSRRRGDEFGAIAARAQRGQPAPGPRRAAAPQHQPDAGHGARRHDRERHRRRPQRAVLFANASAGRLLGFHPDKVEGLPLLEAVRSHELRDAVQQALRSRQLANCELTWRGGSPRTFDVLATPLPGDPPPGRRARAARRQRAEAARADAAAVHRQRVARAEDAAQLDQGVHRDAAGRRPQRSRSTASDSSTASTSRPPGCRSSSSTCSAWRASSRARRRSTWPTCRWPASCGAASPTTNRRPSPASWCWRTSSTTPSVRVHADEEGAAADSEQPDRQRGEVHARRRPRVDPLPARTAGWPTSRWPTRASASPRSTTTGCSSGSTGSTRPAPASWAARAWGCRSSSTCARRWAAASGAERGAKGEHVFGPAPPGGGVSGGSLGIRESPPNAANYALRRCHFTHP